MDELKDLLRGMTEGMNGGKAPRRDRPAPPGLPSRSQRLGRTEPALCKRCGGAGFLIDDLPVGHPDYGRPVPCRCKLDERRSRRRSHFKDAHKLAALARFTFETFNTDLSYLPPHKLGSLVRAYDAAHEFALKPEGWLLFTGTYGCGKTHLAAAIANHRIENDHSAVFVVVPDLLDHLRSTFGPSSEASYDDVFDEVRNTAVLVLDDLGVQVASPWTQEKMFQILNDRYNRQLPTVLTTNQRLEDLDQRLRSRLQDQELVRNFPILATDYRAGANPGQGDLSTLSFHASHTFEAFDVQRRNASVQVNANLRRAREAAEAFASSPSGWLILLGASGAGKTHLAAAISNTLRAGGLDDVMFVVVPDLLDYLRAAFNPQSPVPYDRRFDELKRTPMLVLDDLGTESATPWAKEKLFQLLNYRYTAQKTTVITSRVPEDRLEPWLRTRINDAIHCQVLTLETTSYRGSADQVEARQLKQPQKPSSGEIPY
ncbi:MAG: AAA family ATPase [Caldilineaceae bacterium SB0661_bin_32]|uniref:AAA family ATPase n=1 Tax=Caldilineaceae bacterium SB0661_bin_32 TaxID=2605255 RepID=A0A6B1D3M1_9CHLR|nr:AAA family ATPase [Caldilineaceae bacterium SB0661_bin_32]